MLSEKVLFALNNTDDSFLEETRELLGRSAVSQKPAKSRIIRTILIAAVLALYADRGPLLVVQVDICGKHEILAVGPPRIIVRELRHARQSGGRIYDIRRSRRTGNQAAGGDHDGRIPAVQVSRAA